MNWDREIEVEGNKGVRAELTVGDLQSVLMSEITKDEMEEFVQELVKFVELSPAPGLLEEG